MASWGQRTEVTPDPRPPKRIVATKAEWGKIREHFAGACCVATGLPYQHLHHIAFRRADSGDDVIENLAPLTNEAHERLHKRAAGWERVAAAIRQYVIVDNERRRYAEDKLGARFNSRYPALPNTDPQFLSDRQIIFEKQFGVGAVEGHEAA